MVTIKGMGRKGKTLSAFKTHSPFQPCRLPRQTSPSGFCYRSSQWERPISCTWRGEKIDQLRTKDDRAHPLLWLHYYCTKTIWLMCLTVMLGAPTELCQFSCFYNELMDISTFLALQQKYRWNE